MALEERPPEEAGGFASLDADGVGEDGSSVGDDEGVGDVVESVEDERIDDEELNCTCKPRPSSYYMFLEVPRKTRRCCTVGRDGEAAIISIRAFVGDAQVANGEKVVVFAVKHARGRPLITAIVLGGFCHNSKHA